MLSVDAASAALNAPPGQLNGPPGDSPLDELGSLASFQPEYRREKPEDLELPHIADPGRRRQLLKPDRSWNLRLLAAGLTLLAVAQAAIIGVLLLRRNTTSSDDRPERTADAVSAAAPTTTGTAGSTEVVASAAGAKTPGTSPNGRLRVSSTPAGATVMIDGQRRGTAPLTIDSIAPGTHRVQLVNGSSSIEQPVTVEAGSTTSLLIPMLRAEAWVNVSAAVPLQVFEQGNLVGTSAEPIQLKPGPHSLELRNESLGYVSQSKVSLKPGELLALKPTLPDGLLQVNAVPWAHVFVDGRPVGDTPLGTLKASLGPHEIRFQHPERGEQVRQVVVSALAPTRISVDFR